MMNAERIPCMRCKYYHVTFDPSAPRGCKLYGFKSTNMPYILVKQSTGHDCSSFEEKNKNDLNKKEEKTDFNDPKYWGKS
jgi:hypothetical protein